MIAHPWKCRSYLPTLRAIMWTNCEKGSFQIRSSVLFWNYQISQRATVQGQNFLVFLTFPAWRNSFWGACPTAVWSFLLAGSSLPDIDGLASAAIWANCQVSSNEGDLPTPVSCSASAIWHTISSACGGASMAGVGGCTSDEGLFCLVSTLVAALICSIFVSPPLFPWHGVTFILAFLEVN